VLSGRVRFAPQVGQSMGAAVVVSVVPAIGANILSGAGALFLPSGVCTIARETGIALVSPPLKRTLGLLLWLGLVGMAARPIGPLETLLGFVLAPLGPAAELASPLWIVRRPEVRAAERDLLAAWDEEARAGQELLAALARHANPTDPALVDGRRLVHAEVVGRGQDPDFVRARVRDARGLERDLPVVHGDVFVGRVQRVGPAVGLDLGEIEIQLVTSPDCHVGARAADGETGAEVDMVVGGLDEPRRLAVHSPSDRGFSGGLARVHARLPGVDPHLALAEGYRLGLVRRGLDPGHWSLEAELDYRDGLFHLVVLAQPDGSLPSDEPMPQALADHGWRRADPLSHGDPSPWRDAARVAVGTAHGARTGAAVAFGARLVGRLGAAGPWSSDALFLGDVGFSVVAVALFEDDGVPRVLGRLVSLGREDGAVRLRAAGGEPLPLDPDGEDGCRTARLFTGSGDAGVPSGLYLGQARVPVGEAAEGERVVRLLAASDAGSLHELWVRVEGAAGARREAR